MIRRSIGTATTQNDKEQENGRTLCLRLLCLFPVNMLDKVTEEEGQKKRTQTDNISLCQELKKNLPMKTMEGFDE
jgi:hypothetical protein